MRIVINEEAHNRVVWSVETVLVKLEIGLAIAWLILALSAAFTGSPVRWILIAGAGAVLLAVGLLLAWKMPLAETGVLERPPEGGGVQRTSRWLLRREESSWTLPLGDVAGFRLETRTFEETRGQTYPMARLWTIPISGESVQLTPWVAPQEAHDLGVSLAKAGRLAFDTDLVLAVA